MKNLKKVLALVIALTMVLTTVAFASYPDVDANANYASAVELLSALEILQGDENGNFNPDNTITRAEYAAVVCRALGMENAANSAKGATIFTDVAADHWATGYINLASQQGIVNGKGNGIFDPEGNVTYAEAVKMLVVALGYEPMAASRGGYPTGYLTVANSTKITANVSSSGTDTAALRSTVAQLTANALEVANMDQTGFGTDTKYEVLDDYDNYTTLLTKMDIYKATGVVTKVDATDDTATIELSEASDDYEFGYKNSKGDVADPLPDCIFNINGSNIESYLQQSVDVYVYKAGKSDYDIVYVTASGIGTSLKIDADDLADDKAVVAKKTANKNTDEATRVEYYENSDATKTTKIDVVAGAPIYVNGYNASNELSYPVNLDALLKDTGATVEFVENTDDKYYDMVLITVYQHGIVDEASASKEKITFLGSNPGSVKFDSADSKQVVNMTDKNGNAITLEDVKKDDVLAMLVKGDSSNVKVGSDGVLSAPAVKNFATTSNEITIVDLGANTVTGSIDSSDEDTIYIDDTEYDLGIFVDGNKDKIYKNGEAKLGTEGTFYLDINGKVIGFDGTTGGNTSFGYILQAEYNTSNSFEKGWEVKMLTEKNGIVTFTMNTSYTINDAADKSAKDTGATTKTTEADKFLSAFTGKTGFKDGNTARLVEYKVTSDNKIKTLDNLATVKTAFKDGEYKNSTTKVGSYVLDDDVVVFNLDESDIDDVTVGNLSTLVDEGKYSGYVADDTASPSEYGIFVVTTGTTKYAPEDGFFVVSGTKTSTLGDKDSKVVTYYDVDVSEKTATFTDDSKQKGSVEYGDLKKGDVFVANLNSEGVVKDYAVLAQFDKSTNKIEPVKGAFAAAYGTDMQEVGLDKGVDYVIGYLTKINTSSGKQVLDVCYDGNEKNAESFAIGKDASAFNYAQGKNGTIKCDWDGDNVDTPDDNGKCTFVFLKLYDGTVTDIYTVDIRMAKFVGKTTAAVATKNDAEAASKTEVKEEVKEETPVVEVPVAEEDFE